MDVPLRESASPWTFVRVSPTVRDALPPIPRYGLPQGWVANLDRGSEGDHLSSGPPPKESCRRVLARDEVLPDPQPVRPAAGPSHRLDAPEPAQRAEGRARSLCAPARLR